MRAARSDFASQPTPSATQPRALDPQHGISTAPHPALPPLPNAFPLVLIDGGSGSGKTTLAQQLFEALRPYAPRLQLVHLDEFYPGWHGLAAGSQILESNILRYRFETPTTQNAPQPPHATPAHPPTDCTSPRAKAHGNHDEPGYFRWDWEHNEPGSWVRVPADVPLIVEGCGSLTRVSRRYASTGVWMAADPQARKKRALTRDRGAFDAWWDIWAAQESAHWAANAPWELADVTVNMLR
ncbi:hypothetical protein [Gleimia hominis]|uniref:hypothetical protein n=1 Tax=Gleimia hominis TaxID=595468 RepID=UPI0011AFA749|nr:hypothetical protein [Gleimia hominis]WIK64515.1 hypothetical protein CJ187_000130 [Gleimia hominis]